MVTVVSPESPAAAVVGLEELSELLRKPWPASEPDCEPPSEETFCISGARVGMNAAISMSNTANTASGP